MVRWTRRGVLARLAIGGAGIVLGRHVRATAPPARAETGAAGLDELAGRIRASTSDDVFDVGARALAAGAEPATLLGAAFVAGIRDIRPRGVGGKFHAVLMVESAFQLVELSSPGDARIAALWNLWDFKRCQERDVREEGDWTLPPRPDVTFPDEPTARRELIAALEAWDAERADRAIVGLLPFHDRASIFEILWPYGLRCYADLGHKAIFCVHAERTLARLGPRHAEDTLRSLVRGLLYVTESGPQTTAFAAAERRIDGFPKKWREGREDPASSLALLRRLRDASATDSQAIVVEAFREGLGPRSVWDGLRLHAAEIFHRRPATAARRHGPVHPVTELNAMAYVFRTTRHERTRRLALLQTAGWLAHLRDDLQRIFGTRTPSLVDALGDELDRKAPTLRALFEQPSAAGARVRMDLDERGPAAYLAQLRRYLYERAFQDHQYKFVAALHEEASRLDPRWASRFLGPAITYVPTAADPVTEMRRRSRQALRRAGLG